MSKVLVKHDGKWKDASWVPPPPATIYGFKIDESVADPDKRVEYTDMAIGMKPAKGHDLGDWANTKLFQEIKPVAKMGDQDGSWRDLHKRHLWSFSDDTGSHVEIIGRDAFTEFPTWWVHEHAEGKVKYVKIADQQVDETYHAMHSMDNGVVRNCFHVGCYHGYRERDFIFSSRLRQPSGNLSITQFIQFCQNRNLQNKGKGFDLMSWYAYNYICILFVLAYKSTNCQTALGKGYVNGSGVTKEGETDFDNDFGLLGSSSGTEHMAFLWLYDLWGNMYQFIGGAKTNSQNQLMVILDGKDCTTNESDFTTVGSGGKTGGFGGYISEMDVSSSKVGFFPKATSGSATTHWCDSGVVSPSDFPRVGGNFSDGDNAGLFRVLFNYSATDTYSNYGSRLMYKGGRE